MPPVRYDNSVGTLGASLTTTATTITFASAPSWSTLTAGQYITLVLDPPTGTTPNASFEVVYVTAYTSGATTATISSSSGGGARSGVAHGNGATWEVGPTAEDFLSVVFDASASPKGIDSTGVTNGQALVYNSTSGKFVPGSGGGSGNTASSVVALGNIGTAQTVNLASTADQIVYVTGTLTANCTVTLSNRAAGCQVWLLFAQDGTGGRTLTISDGTNSQAVTIPTTAGSYFAVLCVCPDATTIDVSSLSVPGPTGPAGTSGSNISNLARGYRNAALSWGSTTWQKIPIDTASFDLNGNLDVTTSHRYNIPTTGYYQVEAQANIHFGSAGETDALVAVYYNGAAVSIGGGSPNGPGLISMLPTLSDVIHCTAGGYLELYAFADSGCSLTLGGSPYAPVSANNFMTVFQVA